MSLSSRLKNRIDVYGKVEFTNELGEKDYKFGKLKSVWAEITPQSGSVQSGQGNIIYTDVSYKFVIRSNALSEITNDMYFMFKNQRYDINYYNPNYKYRDSVEIFCNLVVE